LLSLLHFINKVNETKTHRPQLPHNQKKIQVVLDVDTVSTGK